ncbi:MAG: Zn-dependent hydrolase [Lachnospiraceae bacterium]|nr:Zn-dependent hydrolase [Lachnospiraceae bacterium]
MKDGGIEMQKMDGANCGRLLRDIEDLASIGGDERTGTNRMAYSKAFLEGRDFVKKRMEEAGLETRVDRVGNLYGLLQPTDCTAGFSKRIAVGSHIDTVPHGGKYDGALGVLGGIEAVRRLRAAGYGNRHPIEIIAFNEEEGNVIGGTFGSKAFAGAALEEAMLVPMEDHGITEEDFRSCRVSPDDYFCYMEYHIEQGGILERDQKEIGIVEGIFGIVRYRAVVTGKANHAGSTPMDLRDDALEKSCRIIEDLMKRTRRSGNTMVATVGTIRLDPGAVNVIPGKAEFIIELRDKTVAAVFRLIEELRERWQEEGLSLEEYLIQPETVCDPGLETAIEESAKALGFSTERMYSGAGHDVINTSFVTPSGMLFIPSIGGISHHRDEYSCPQDIERGVAVLTETIMRIDGGNR